MSSTYDTLSTELRKNPRIWTVTGAAGFIGSHLVETLLGLQQTVIGLDDFSTGSKENLSAVQDIVGDSAWRNFILVEGDIRDLAACRAAMKNSTVLLHQAALASVPRSINDPISSTQVNVDGFVNVSVAARDAGIKRIVYASSSSVYGDSAELPKVEEHIGEPLSPYALSKYADELYAAVFARIYGLEFIGLRYFNVFGPRQSLDGPYAAVLPCWIRALKAGTPCELYGDGTTSRDFCYVSNAVQANLLAACTTNPGAIGTAYNIAVGEQTSLQELYTALVHELESITGKSFPERPTYLPFRQGDIKHSLASIEKAKQQLGFSPTVRIAEGLKHYVAWIAEQLW